MTFYPNFPLCFSAYPSSIIKFFCLMDLHYSQTKTASFVPWPSFTTLWIYTILKHRHPPIEVVRRFTTLWIYTILKPFLIRPALWAVSLPYGFTLFSNKRSWRKQRPQFYYLMDLHYSQTSGARGRTRRGFYYLMDLHYSQTCLHCDVRNHLFYYLMDLHYSQTWWTRCPLDIQFYYLMDLHYSQTAMQRVVVGCWFYYLIDLHYSQTLGGCWVTVRAFYYLIDLHYSQTKGYNVHHKDFVLLPYRFTLFSNLWTHCHCYREVLLPYRFTLFSNLWPHCHCYREFYYLIDLHYSQTVNDFVLNND